MKGRVISGPSQRLHFHLELQLGQETSRVDFFSDGTRVVEIQSLPGQEKKVKKMDLPRIQRPTDDPAAIARDREAALQGKNFKGIGPLLAQIRAGLGDPQLQAVRCQGEELLEIKGKWEVPNDLFNALPKNLRPQVLPRQCRVYLNATTLWPRYVEWWGAGPGGQAKKLLVRTEYGPPIINQPLPPEKLAKTFSPSE
jgi:hypothetical protein